MHARLLLRWNASLDLTAITDPAEVIRRHFAEPLVALPLIEPEAALLDLGTGGGFPGLPLHVARGGGGRLILVERSANKVEFLRTVVLRCCLSGVELVERHVRRPSDLAELGPVDAVTFRAVPDPRGRVEWLASLLRPGGLALLFLGREGAGQVEREAAGCGLVPECRKQLAGAEGSFLIVIRKPLP
jgi:16S rRNA (guanine527-N7)-methyltransferase